MFDLEKEKKSTAKLIDELHTQFVEMGQIKTRFDSEKFTVGKEGNFVASQFHSLMRQYRLAIQETRRMLLDYEEAKRKVEYLLKEADYRNNKKDYETNIPETKKELSKIEHIDIETNRQEMRMKALEISIQGRLWRMNDFETLRKRLIEINDGKAPTNEQFQAEQPEYYRWFIAKKMVQQMQQQATGITEGMIEAHEMAARKPILSDSKMKIKSLMSKTSQGQILFDIDALHASAFLDCDNLKQMEKSLEEKYKAMISPKLD